MKAHDWKVADDGRGMASFGGVPIIVNKLVPRDKVYVFGQPHKMLAFHSEWHLWLWIQRLESRASVDRILREGFAEINAWLDRER